MKHCVRGCLLIPVVCVCILWVFFFGEWWEGVAKERDKSFAQVRILKTHFNVDDMGSKKCIRIRVSDAK